MFEVPRRHEQSFVFPNRKESIPDSKSKVPRAHSNELSHGRVVGGEYPKPEEDFLVTKSRNENRYSRDRDPRGETLENESEKITQLQIKLDKKEKLILDMRQMLNEVYELNEKLRGENHSLKISVEEQAKEIKRLKHENIELAESVSRVLDVGRDKEASFAARMDDSGLDLEAKVLALKNDTTLKLYQKLRQHEIALQQLRNENNLLRERDSSLGKDFSNELADLQSIVTEGKVLLQCNKNSDFLPHLRAALSTAKQAYQIQLMITDLVSPSLGGISMSSPNKSAITPSKPNVVLSLKKCWKFIKNVLKEYVILKKRNVGRVNQSLSLSPMRQFPHGAHHQTHHSQVMAPSSGSKYK